MPCGWEGNCGPGRKSWRPAAKFVVNITCEPAHRCILKCGRPVEWPKAEGEVLGKGCALSSEEESGDLCT